MENITLNKMTEGLTLEQLQKMGAKPVQRVGGLTLSQLQAQGATPVSQEVQQGQPKTPGVTFGSTGTESPVSAGFKTLGNVPSSAVNFGKGVANFLNPVNTVKTAQDLGQGIYDAGQEGVKASDVIKGIPQAAYQTLVPQFFQHLFAGDTEAAQKIITEDPIGQIAPVILSLRGVAEKAGVGEQFDKAVSKTTEVATKPITGTAKTLGNIATNTLGITTGAGGEAVKTAFQGGPDFTNAMRGNTSMQDVLQESQDAVSKLINMRSTEYQGKLADIKTNTKSLDISPIFKTMEENLKSFNVKPVQGEIVPESFSRSTLQNDPSGQEVFKTIYDNLKTYGTKEGDRTPIALDTLKRSLGDLYSPSSSVRSFVQSMKGSVKTILDKNVSGYSDMTKGYEQYSGLLKDIKQSLAIGGKAGEETAIKRLSGALKQNNELRLEVLGELEKATGINLKDKVAGAALNEKIPRGMIGKGIDVYAVSSILRGIISPTVLAQILTTSPRFVGELMNALGIGTRTSWKLVKPLNEPPMIVLQSSALSTKNKK